MNNCYAINIPQAYVDMMFKMHVWGSEEGSRNGPVLTSQEPVCLEIAQPTERVLFDPVRDANPFFHVMEFVWMMTGSRDVSWIKQFNKRFTEYAEPNGIIHGAYGYRWIKNFMVDQIRDSIKMLKADRATRRCVISMWDPATDLGTNYKDLPCNTSLMFRVVEGQLDMTVINRSNDMIWGMLGANAVHMTLLHELIAHEAGIELGMYRVFTNNCHVYKNMPKFEEIWRTTVPVDHYRTGKVSPMNLLNGDDTYEDLLVDCCRLVARDEHPLPRLKTEWMSTVAWPIYCLWHRRQHGDLTMLDQIQATDWRLACKEWLSRREIPSK